VKKKLTALLAVMMLCLLAMPVFAADVNVSIDGQALSFPDQQPYIDEANRTMVPLRAPLEAIGATVEWDQEKLQATLTKDEIVAVFTIGSATYMLDGVANDMDTQAVLTEGRTCIPIRYAAEALGATVAWDGDTYTVEITTAVVTDEDAAVTDEDAIAEEDAAAATE
jgi:hypothetical protein